MTSTVVWTPKDSAELHNLPLTVTVTVTQREDNGDLTNEIGAWARTDAAAGEGVEAAIARARAYVAAGADLIFAEALTTLDDYRKFTAAIPAPVLANLTEFGRTPLFTLDEMRSAGVAMVLAAPSLAGIIT